MSKLSYRTVAGEDPQGKPKVYFSCHPDDFGIYFEEYALKILHIQDCAIWYEAEPEADYDREDLELNLSQMQLFVMPVTTKLLTTPNRAMNIEFPFAQEKYIPVLPLMMEGSLDDVFSKRFGDLQYLDPNDKDATRRSFDEVLETYIRSVLVSSDLAKRVRAAFDAYIFLSYRKKDRKKAQELMRLIHRNPFCRDIAIWYDEFLTPGEDFNQAIGEMLTKSSLFTLVVTPNLVNEINYVMTTEYPAALKQEKPVLPVEMERTDRAQLEELYEALPPCVLGEDDEMLRESLLEKIREIAVSANDADPEHNFLIGLAYLDGIDVEVDSERAMSLIKGAAEAGVTEAISHLIMMYETGKGTERDYRKGIEWREKQVGLLRKKFEVEPGEETAWKLSNELWLLGDAQYDLKMLEAAETSYHEMNIIAEQYAGSENRSLQRSLSISYGKLGNIAKERENLAEALVYYMKSHSITEKLARDTGTVEARQDLSVSYSKLGSIASARWDLSEAVEYYTKGLAIREKLAEEIRSVKSREDLSASYMYMGDITFDSGDIQGARVWYEKCFTICSELEEEISKGRSRKNLSLICLRLGDIARIIGNAQEAWEQYEKGIAILEEIVKETGTIDSRRELSLGYRSLGDLSMVKGSVNPRAARYWYEKGIAICEDLVTQTGTIESRRDLYIFYCKMGEVDITIGYPTWARQWYEKALGICEELAKKNGKVESRKDLSIIYESLGSLFTYLKQLDEAQEWYEKALAIGKELEKETESIVAKRRLAVIYYNYGTFHFLHTKDYSTAKMLLEHAQELEEDTDDFTIEKVREKTKRILNQKVIRSVDLVSDLGKTRRDLAVEQLYYEKELVIREKLANESGTVESRLDLSACYEKLGDMAKGRGDFAVAQGYYEKKLAICEELEKETGTMDSRADLFSCYMELGKIAESQNNLDMAHAYYKKGGAINVIGKLNI